MKTKLCILLLLFPLPLFAQDTDNDGASDSYEVATGFDPNNSSSTPPVSPAIGLNFRRSVDPEEATSWPSDQFNGYLPQVNWNQVVTNGNESIASDQRILTPRENVAVDAAGSSTTLTFSSDFFIASRNNATGTPARNLNAGYLLRRGSSVGFVAAGVPYTSYDVYVYVSGPSNLGINTVHLNRDGADPQSTTIRPMAARGPEDFVITHRVGEGVIQRANVVIFENLTAPAFTLHVDDDFAGVGLAGVQIVNRTADSDSDGIPDWWELIHKTDASIANADADPDGDQLNNLGEFLIGSDPHDADSDDDGLSDLVETNTGVFISATSTGTDPSYADSDEDSLSDYSEVFDFNPSNPNLVDSDGDGINDDVERELGTPAMASVMDGLPDPQVATADEVRWEFENIQLKWNHNIPIERGWLVEAKLENREPGTDPEDDSVTTDIGFGLYEASDGGLTWRIFALNATRAWAQADRTVGFNETGEIDVMAACGFSGYGDSDFSDLLTFSLIGEENADQTWKVTFAITNQRTGADVFRYVENNAKAHSSIRDGFADWQSRPPNGDSVFLSHAKGVEVFYTPQRVDLAPFFADQVDINHDGIPDQWAANFNLTTAADADQDGDGLSNREEYLAGSNPTLVDSDFDGVSDFIEWNSFTDASDSASRPPFAQGVSFTGSDLDGNGLSDLWETRYSRGFSLIANADPDRDGFSNREEDIAGTDPFDAASNLSLSTTRMANGLQFLWNARSDKRTRLESSDGLGEFTTILGANSGVIMPFKLSRNFYRLNVTDQDRDADGLFDADEALLGTSPTDANSIGRPVLQDLDGNGTAESTLSADYAAFLERYGSRADSNASNADSLSPREASRFLMQATFGPTRKSIDELRKVGLEAWVEDQIHTQPISSYRKLVDEFIEDLNGPQLHTGLFYTQPSAVNPAFLNQTNINTVFAQSAVKGSDQLRQRVAFALTQFFVISRIGTNGTGDPELVSLYYDMLSENAFGNYYDLLKMVTRNNSMGRYLSSINNQKSDPSISRFPDENYAREVMQLFTIGIHELHNDGSLRRDENGQLIETYDTFDVTEMARVMTGFQRPFQSNDDPFATGSQTLPMVIIPERHDFGAKQILKRHTIPAREASVENGDQDIDDALLVLFNHQNTPPFISKTFIQFLITDNPSPEYIERVANVFIDNGEGERGDMEAVIKAILFDPEARDIAIADSREEFGRLRDPLLRMMHLCRLLQMDRHETLYWWSVSGNHAERTGQEIFASPTVFNFYNPQHKPAGPLLDNDLVGAPFQIMDTITAVTLPNFLWAIITEGFQQPPRTHHDGYNLTPFYDEFLPFANDHEALADQLDLLFCGGRMKLASRNVILEALADPRFENAQRLEEKVQVAIYLAVICPESAITH